MKPKILKLALAIFLFCFANTLFAVSYISPMNIPQQTATSQNRGTYKLPPRQGKREVVTAAKKPVSTTVKTTHEETIHSTTSDEVTHASVTTVTTVKRSEPVYHHANSKKIIVAEPTHVNSTTHVIPKNNSMQVSPPVLPYFNAIDVDGDVNVIIHTSTQQQPPQFEGDENDFSCVRLKVVNDTLFIRHRAKHFVHVCKSVVLNLTMKQLTHITHDGAGFVNADDVNTNHLSIDTDGVGSVTVTGQHVDLRELNYHGDGEVAVEHINAPGISVVYKGHGSVNLQGKGTLNHLVFKGDGALVLDGFRSSMMNLNLDGNGTLTFKNGKFNLHKLYCTGNGVLEFYWLKSVDLSIEAGGTETIKLAGMAHLLHLKLFDHAHVDARYLHTYVAFVETHEYSEAEVLVRDTLYSFALDRSNVYYFREPYHWVHVHRQSGNLLPMYDIPSSLTYFNRERF